MNCHRSTAIFRSLLLIGLTALGCPIDVSPQGENSKKPEKPTQATAVPVSNQAGGSNSNLTRLEKSRKSINLGRSFLIGVLPSPSQIPSGSPDEQAATLARYVGVGDENSTAALHAAVLAAGFAVRNLDKTITQLVRPGQGLVFDAGEVAAMAKMYSEERTAPITEVGLLIGGLSPKINKDRVATLLLEGIKRHAHDGGNRHLRFWARFIVELGRQKGVDILTLGDATSLRIDPVQHAFIMRRLIGDLAAYPERGKLSGAITSGDIFYTPTYVPFPILNQDRSWPGLFVKANYSAQISSISASLQSSPPCKLEGDAGTIMDGGALVISTGFGAVLGYLEETLGNRAGKALGKYGSLASAANALLAYIKFIQSYAALETVIEMDGTGPLIRTRNSVPGARRKFLATSQIKIGKWQTFNCVRLALVATTGIDFNTMNDGPLAGVITTWHLDKGGAGDRYSNNTGLSGDEQIVGIVNEGPRIQDQGAYAGIGGASGAPVNNATRTVTDDRGRATITVEGSPQKNHKMGKVTAVIKHARLRTNIQLKGGDVKGDAVDALSQAAGGVSGVITLPAELLYRTDWASTAHYEFEVQDWDDSDVISIRYVYSGYKFVDSMAEDCPKMRTNGQEVLTAQLRLVGSRDGRSRYEGTGRFSANIDGCGLTPDRKDPGINGTGFGGFSGDNFLGCIVTSIAPEREVRVTLMTRAEEGPHAPSTVDIEWEPVGRPPDVTVTSDCERAWNAGYLKDLSDGYARKNRLGVTYYDSQVAPGGILQVGTHTDPDGSPEGRWTLTITTVEDGGGNKE